MKFNLNVKSFFILQQELESQLATLNLSTKCFMEQKSTLGQSLQTFEREINETGSEIQIVY